MEDTGLFALHRENFQMHAVFRTVFAKAVLIIDCRIIAVKQRPSFLTEYIGYFLKTHPQVLPFLRQRLCLEACNVFRPGIVKYRVDEETKCLGLLAGLL